jgi:hypothetical protein
MMTNITFYTKVLPNIKNILAKYITYDDLLESLSVDIIKDYDRLIRFVEIARLRDIEYALQKFYEEEKSQPGLTNFETVFDRLDIIDKKYETLYKELDAELPGVYEQYKELIRDE